MGKLKLWTIPAGFAALLFISTAVLGQDSQIVQTSDKITIQSRILKEERSIVIRVPADYKNGSDRYPVVYVLDGQGALVSLMTGTIEHLVWSDLMPEMIQVNIPNTIRPRDMTPAPISGQPETGGAASFLQFIEQEVIPLVEQKYRVQPYRVITGHSMSGLFVAYAFAAKPQLFNAYFAGSPGLTLPWDNGFVPALARETLKNTKELNRTLVFTLGDEPNFETGFFGFRKLLDSLHIKGLEYEFLQVAGENHWSTVSIAFQKGLRKVWSYLLMPPEILRREFSLDDIDNHYKAASARYGYTIPPPQRVLNRAGFTLMDRKQLQEAIRTFRRAVALYPASPYTYNSLAEGLERNGELQEAKTNIEKALQMAEQAGNERGAQTFRDHLKRVNAAIAEKKKQ